jgi:hypothetical protein
MRVRAAVTLEPDHLRMLKSVRALDKLGPRRHGTASCRHRRHLRESADWVAWC